MATMTLGEFEREYGVNRGTVHKRAQDMGFSTSEGLSIEAVDELQAYYKVGAHAPVQQPQQPEETGSELLVVDGELTGLELPEFKPYTLGLPDVLAESYEDPMAIALRFLEFGDQLIDRLEANTSALAKRAEDTRTAAQLVADKNRRLASAQRSAEIQEAVSTAFIQRDMAELQRQGRVA
jgi:hypothetical protein